MKLTHFGKDVIVKVFLAGIAMTLISIFIDNIIVKFLLTGITIFIWLFTLYFFRDPDRRLPADYKDNQIISPADGKVVVIEDVINKEDNIFKKDEQLIQISIFLSPLNVHVNRNPISGTVKYLKYIKGEYLVAFDHKSSERNERTEIGIENPENGCKILFKQIAGFVARRIVYDLSEDCKVKAGDRFGMIKFGSRIDILIKRDSEIFVKMDQKVTGGETIIAEL
ncbi:MAG: phosphatidylserine decarboxylase family protein [Bacteroidetes bacterium]|nr:phosphatidylserine decarboxylase family protein [Bacteroidota bacterium]